MQKISLSKALKLKNRLTGRLSQLRADILLYNSVLLEKVGQVNVRQLIEEYEKLTDYLVDLKHKLHVANVAINHDLLSLTELKGYIALYQGLPTKDGKERHGYQNTEITYVAEVKKAEVDASVRDMERELDALQDKIDAFNATTYIEVGNDLLNI